MKRKFIILLVLMVFVSGSVSAQLLSSIGSLFNVDALGKILKLAVGGVIGVAVIAGLQYIGIDILGMTFNFLFFMVDLGFSILRFVLASEGNLVSFVVIFIILWFVILFL